MGLIADFRAHRTKGVKSLLVKFTDYTNGIAEGYSWDFGDGSSSVEQNPEHFYRKPGRYTVALTVWDQAGQNTKTRVEYIVITSDYVLDNGPQPEAVVYLTGEGLAVNNNVGVKVFSTEDSTSGFGFSRPFGPTLIFD